MSTPRRFLLAGTLALLLTWLVLAMAAYPALPAQLATHFGPSGTPDHFSTKSIGTWFALPAVGAATTLLILGLGALLPTRPALLNTPAKAELLALPAAQQQPLLEEVATMMSLLGLGILVLFATIHFDSWRVSATAQRGLSPLTWTVMGITLGGSTIGMLVWNQRFTRRVLAARDAVARAHAATASPQRRSS